MLGRGPSQRHRHEYGSRVQHLESQPPDTADPTQIRPRSLRRRLTISIYRRLEPRCGKPSTYASLPTPRSGILPHSVKLLCQTLRLPPETPVLTSRIASLPDPLTRSSDSLASRNLCGQHTWLDGTHPFNFADLVGQELHVQCANFFHYIELLNPDTQQALQTVQKYKILFPLTPSMEKVERITDLSEAFSSSPSSEGESSDPSSSPSARTTPSKDPSPCLACDLGTLLRDEDAMTAFRMLCKARKKHGRQWPELLAFLEPIESGEDGGWEGRWKKEARPIREDRRMIRQRIQVGDSIDVNGEGGEGWDGLEEQEEQLEEMDQEDEDDWPRGHDREERVV